jgi:hypothetical protein
MTTEAYNAGVTEAEYAEVQNEINGGADTASRHFIVRSVSRTGTVSEFPVSGTMAEAVSFGQRYGCKTVSVRIATDDEWNDHMGRAESANRRVMAQEGC